MKKSKQVVSLLLVFIMAIGMTFTTGCSKKSDPSKTLVVTVGDHKVFMDEVMFYIFNVEAAVTYNAQMYQQNGTSYWDIEQEGQTLRDKAKQNVMDTLVMYEILYEKALAEGFTLTDEEQTANQAKVDQLLAATTDEQLKITGFTKESLLKVHEKIVVAEKYYKKLVDSFDIDDNAITKTINKEDYKEYTTEYLFARTVNYDANYNMVDLSDKEKAAAKKSIDDALVKVKEGKKFADIVKDDATISTNTRDFVLGDNSAEPKYQEASAALEKGATTSEIVETEYGYYIIKLIDNTSTASYDKAVSEAIASAEADKFNTEFEKIKKDYTITINKDVWDPIVMGKTTLIETKEANTTEANTTESNTTDSNTTDSNTTESNTTESK